MNSNDRFYACESLGFPEVSIYDYDTNVPNRGVDDRTFRWQEVAVESIYLFKEATASGSFESNSFVSDFSISRPTGVNFITTGNSNSTSYKGWTLTGSRIIYIGISGIFVSSGDMSGVVSSFQAHPLDGDEALGLYCYSGTSNIPAILSNSLVTGAEGPVINNGRHQVYLQAKLNYGSSGSLNVYPRGWNGGSIVAYYNPFSGVWSASAPSSGFAVSTGRSTIKYDFTCSSFPSTTPTSYDLFISNPYSNTFVTVDDVHIDAYLKKNAFVDYVIPTGYMLQLTPDIGWHNVLAMFESRDTLSNPHLKVLGPFEVSLGNLTDNLDNTVSATLDQDDFISSVTSNFTKYLWRAVPISPNGNLGRGGLPQKFNYVGNIVNNLFGVQKVIEDDTSTLKVIVGKKSDRMTVLVDGLPDNPGLTYPTPTTWKLEIVLTGPSRKISLKGKDSGGATSVVTFVTLVNKLYDQEQAAVWNVFDEHGLIADIERLPNESNYAYSLRIKDSYKNRGGSHVLGIINGASRELSIDKVSDAITFSLSKNQYNQPIVPSAQISVTSYSVRITTDSFITTEKLLVDPIYNTVDLTYLPVDIPEFVELDEGYKLDITDIEIEDICTDSKRVYRLKLKDIIASGKFIQVKYKYYEELLFKNHSSIESIINKLNQIVDPSGQKIFDAAISGNLSGIESSLGLIITNLQIVGSSAGSISWSPVYLKKISDRGYRDYFITEENYSLKNSEYYSFVKELKNNTKIFWGAVESDRDRWDAADSKSLSMDSVPTLFDPPLSSMVSLVSGKQQNIEAITAWGRNYIGLNKEYLVNVGLDTSLFQPGVAHTNDLVPDIYITTSFDNSSGALLSNIGPLKNDNNVIIFSGQR